MVKVFPFSIQSLEIFVKNQLIMYVTVWVPTLSTVGNLRGTGRFSETDVQRILESALENVRNFGRMGGLLAPGTDAGAWAVPHGSLTEFALLEQALGTDTDRILETGAAEIIRRF